MKRSATWPQIPEWKTGKFKMPIKTGKNVLGKDPNGVVKIAPATLKL